jgi:hypothetical protein
MKTLKKDGQYLRVKDTTKKDLEKLNDYLSSGWEYSSKKEWKENTRVDNKKETNKTKKTKKNKK